MASQDGKSGVKFLGSIAPQAVTGDVNGAEVDTLNFEAVTLVAHGDGTAIGTVKIQATDISGSGYADASASEVIGTQDNDVNATDTEITIGYIGDKRYVRAVWTNTTNGDVAVGFNLGCASVSPVTGND
jgi:hypothetical protein